MFEVERRIGYWQHVLRKLDEHMLDEQSKRMDIKITLIHLQHLQKEVKLPITSAQKIVNDKLKKKELRKGDRAKK